ncbi:MAG: hypothetical protein FJ303_23200 [Planctomycetes bacterium]|nr:hypothetical protein [Planctomycetota bacterium]
MDRMQGIILSILGAAVFAAVLFFVIDYGSEKTYATPQDVFEASRMALRRNDLRAFCQCITDDSRDFMAATMAVDKYVNRELMEKAGTEKKKAEVRAVDDIFKKHGLTEAHMAKHQKDMLQLTDQFAPMKQKLAVARELLEPISDRNGFIAEVFEASMKATGIDHPFLDKKDDKLTNVIVQGKAASGIVETRGGAMDGKDAIEFRKQGEGWRIDLFPERGSGMMPPGMLPPGHP